MSISWDKNYLLYPDSNINYSHCLLRCWNYKKGQHMKYSCWHFLIVHPLLAQPFPQQYSLYRTVLPRRPSPPQPCQFTRPWGSFGLFPGETVWHFWHYCSAWIALTRTVCNLSVFISLCNSLNQPSPPSTSLAPLLDKVSYLTASHYWKKILAISSL